MLHPASRRHLIAALLILAAGIFLRVYPSAGFHGVGFDEALYRDFAVKLDRVGFTNFPAICEVFLEDQRDPAHMAKLPPTRVLYIASAWAWKRIASGDTPPVPPNTPHLTGDPYLAALHSVSCAASILLLATAGAFAWRMAGPTMGLGVLALMACAPTQIHLAQHALIDGFFAFIATLALWLLWENLRRPSDTRLLTALTVVLALMVLTKENAFFVFVALCGIIAANRWARFGTVTPRLLIVMVAGPLAGLLLLISLAGGPSPFIEIYRLLVTKAGALRYAIMTGDGPWYRYLVDLLLVSPIVLCLAIGGLFTSVKTSRPLCYLSAFIGFSYLIMCNVRYGMNLRYTSIWDFPLRALAVAQIGLLARPIGFSTASLQTREPHTLASNPESASPSAAPLFRSESTRCGALVFWLLIAALGAYEIRQYRIFFHDFGLYELASEGLLRAVKILK